MRDIEDNSISLILTDPPYFLHGMDNNWDNNKIHSRIKNGVIGNVPAGMRFDKAQGKNLQEFMKPVAKEWHRIVKPGAFAIVFTAPRLSHHMSMAIEENGFEIRDMLAWKYEGQGKAFSQEHFVRKYNISEEEKQEIIKRLGGRKTPQLKSQMELIIVAQSPKEGTYVNNWLKYGTGLVDLSNPIIEPNRCPGQIIPEPKSRLKYGNIATKPLKLMRHLVKIFSDSSESAIVVDPFAGTGTVGVATVLEGRSFAGFEIDSDMVNVANQRISQTVAKNQDL